LDSHRFESHEKFQISKPLFTWIIDIKIRQVTRNNWTNVTQKIADTAHSFNQMFHSCFNILILQFSPGLNPRFFLFPRSIDKNFLLMGCTYFESRGYRGSDLWKWERCQWIAWQSLSETRKFDAPIFRL
jgi:hypothetical protein